MQSVDSIPVFSYHALDLSVCQEEAKVARKEQEAQEMAEAARAEIDNVMDSIQLRLREAKEKLKQDIAESEKLPSEQRARQQASLIRAFKDHLHEIMSLDGAGERGTHFFFFFLPTVLFHADLCCGKFSHFPRGEPPATKSCYRTNSACCILFVCFLVSFSVSVIH